jgi:hypothetical protein
MRNRAADKEGLLRMARCAASSAVKVTPNDRAESESQPANAMAQIELKNG